MKTAAPSRATRILLVTLLGIFLAQPARADSSITGTIHSVATIKKLVAVDRSMADGQKVSKDQDDPYVYPADVDSQTGKFTVKGLLPRHTYDLIVTTITGRFEGVDMRYHTTITASTPATDDDKAWIKNFIIKMPSFYDHSRPLYIAADHGHATVLVELVRDRDFVNGSGDIIYRAELWYFENYFGGWAKDINTELVITRWRGKGHDIPAPWTYLPTLGGIDIDADGISKPVNVTLPEKPDPKRGIIAPY